MRDGSQLHLKVQIFWLLKNHFIILNLIWSYLLKMYLGTSTTKYWYWINYFLRYKNMVVICYSVAAGIPIKNLVYNEWKIYYIAFFIYLSSFYRPLKLNFMVSFFWQPDSWWYNLKVFATLKIHCYLLVIRHLSEFITVLSPFLQHWNIPALWSG